MSGGNEKPSGALVITPRPGLQNSAVMLVVR
jgi:hypothetical protein